MTERPILFSGPMVRALIAGTKTQTRRVVENINPTLLASAPESHHIANALRCPHGNPGDRLWVRETWAPLDERVLVTQRLDGIAYAATLSMAGQEVMRRRSWRPSIHMPRWASRLTLEVTGVRVERLQDISGADAAAEGVDPIAAWRTDEGVDRHEMPPFTPVPVMRFASLWESIHGYRSWHANPWVWVVEFRK